MILMLLVQESQFGKHCPKNKKKSASLCSGSNISSIATYGLADSMILKKIFVAS